MWAMWKGGERQTTGADRETGGDGAGMCSLDYKVGGSREGTHVQAHIHTHIFNHTVTQCSGEMRCFKGKEVTFLQ